MDLLDTIKYLILNKSTIKWHTPWAFAPALHWTWVELVAKVHVELKRSYGVDVDWRAPPKNSNYTLRRRLWLVHSERNFQQLLFPVLMAVHGKEARQLGLLTFESIESAFVHSGPSVGEPVL